MRAITHVGGLGRGTAECFKQRLGQYKDPQRVIAAALNHGYMVADVASVGGEPRRLLYKDGQGRIASIPYNRGSNAVSPQKVDPIISIIIGVITNDPKKIGKAIIEIIGGGDDKGEEAGGPRNDPRDSDHCYNC